MGEDGKPSDHAVHCEAVKISMSQTKDGWKLILAVHPDDAPEEVLRSFVGTRYMIAAVALDDRDEPVPLIPKDGPMDDGQKALIYSAELCREPAFQRWLFRRGFCSKPDEEHAVQALRVLLNVSSRSELKTNADARKKLREIARDYLDDHRSR